MPARAARQVSYRRPTDSLRHQALVRAVFATVWKPDGHSVVEKDGSKCPEEGGHLSFVLGEPHFAVGHSKLIQEKRPQERHCLFALFAVPEGTHVCFVLPHCDGIPGVGLILISREPMVLQSLHIASQRNGLLEGGFEAVPLAGNDPSPNNAHIHVSSPLFVTSASCHCPIPDARQIAPAITAVPRRRV